MGFRHEIKLLLSEAEYHAFRPLLRGILSPDQNAGADDEYFIRSLYFDDISKSSYFEKFAGVSDRKKYRLRIYNCSDNVIKLECKEKRGDKIRKRSANISRECADKLISGDFSGLESYSDPLCREVFLISRSRGLKPAVVVDYYREAYIHPISNVRLTFDKALHAGIGGADIFSPELMSLPVFTDGSVIFEIKYDDLFPIQFQRLVSSAKGSRLALSKFTLCFDKLCQFKPYC